MQNGKNPFDKDINSYVLNSAKFYALKLVNRGNFPYFLLPDLEHDLLVYFLEESKKYEYDETKSSYKYWVTVIMETGCKRILRKARLYKKHFSQTSLNDFITDNDGECSEVIDFVEDDKSFEEYFENNRKEKLLSVVAKMPDDLKEVCRLLQDKNISQISRELKVSRKSISKKVNKIRAIFKEAGLGD